MMLNSNPTYSCCVETQSRCWQNWGTVGWEAAQNLEELWHFSLQNASIKDILENGTTVNTNKKEKMRKWWESGQSIGFLLARSGTSKCLEILVKKMYGKCHAVYVGLLHGQSTFLDHGAQLTTPEYNIHMESKKTPKSQSNFEKKE